MPQCPKCLSEIQEDYGIVSCLSCGEMILIDMEGIAHFAGEGDEEENQPRESSVPPAEDSENQGLESLEPPEPPSSQQWAEDHEPTSHQWPDQPESMHQEVDDSAEIATPAARGEELDPLSLSTFANSELSQAKDGPFLYRITVSGVDTKEIRESIREAMEDSRFAWDTKNLLGQIKNGVLTLDQVSPVKATVLLSRIKHLPVRINWEQYAITQMEDL